MRIDIWAFGTTPETHPRLCRKKLAYCEEMILRKMLSPIDPLDLRKGCIAARGLRLDEREAEESMKRAAGWGFDSAWGIMESGYAGPGVWQLRTAREVHA